MPALPPLSSIVSHVGTLEAFARGCNWLTYILLPLWLSTTQYGEFSFILAFVLLVSAVGAAGQDRAILRYVKQPKDDDAVGQIRIAFLVTTVFSVFTSVLFVASFSWLEWGGAYAGMTGLVIAWAVLQSIYMLCMAVVRSVHDAQGFILVRALYGIVKLVAICFVAWFYGDITYLLITEIALLTLVTLYTAARFISLRTVDAQKSIARRSLVFGLPLILHVVAGASVGQLDKLMISNMLNDSALGVYAFLNSVAGGVFFVFAVINIVYEVKVYQSDTLENAESTMRRMFLFSISVASVLLILANLLLPFVTEWLDKSEYYQADVMLVLSLAYLIAPLYLQSNIRFAFKEKTSFVPLMSACAAIVNVGLNLWLIPVFGILGGALSTLGAYIVLIVLSQMVSRKL